MSEDEKKEKAKYVGELLLIKMKSMDKKITEMEKKLDEINKREKAMKERLDWEVEATKRIEKLEKDVPFKAHDIELIYNIRKELSELNALVKALGVGFERQHDEIKELKEQMKTVIEDNDETENALNTFEEVLREHLKLEGTDPDLLNFNTFEEYNDYLLEKLGGDTSVPNTQKGKEREARVISSPSAESQPPRIARCLQCKTEPNLIHDSENEDRWYCPECDYEWNKNPSEQEASSASHTDARNLLKIQKEVEKKHKGRHPYWERIERKYKDKLRKLREEIKELKEKEPTEPRQTECKDCDNFLASDGTYVCECGKEFKLKGIQVLREELKWIVECARKRIWHDGNKHTQKRLQDFEEKYLKEEKKE